MVLAQKQKYRSTEQVESPERNPRTYDHLIFFFFLIFLNLWLCWVFVSARGPSPVAASGGHSSSRCAGLSPSRPLPLWSTGSRRAGSAVVAHGPSRSAARGILPDQGPNPRPLHWQADSQPLRHQGSPMITLFLIKEVRIYNGEKTGFLISGAGKTGQLHVKE